MAPHPVPSGRTPSFAAPSPTVGAPADGAAPSPAAPAGGGSPALADAGEELRRLAAGWLLSYGSVHTRRAYATDLAGWVGWCAQLRVAPLHAARVHVDAWARHLAEVTRLAPATVARRLAAVSAFYRWCVLEQHLDANPAVHVRRPEIDPDASATLGLTAAQARVLLHAAGEHSARMRALVALLLVDGLRIGEALALDVAHVREVDRGHRIAVLQRKGGRTTRAALPPLVADAVDIYLLDRAAAETAAATAGRVRPDARRGGAWAGGPSPTVGADGSPAARAARLAGPLFVTRTGARWRAGNATRALTALAAHAGIPGAQRITPHALRHSAITLALDAGVPLHEVQDFAGHRDPRSTRRYDRARGRLDRHASYTLAAHLA